ncbi:uL30 family ribosomal protein [Candidatus Pacearchaeota archaeon]|nr:uL30 family ribosomal protein [Candidatus Pacearchaeota archaeon]
MICIIRIKGEIGLDRDVVETLNRLRLKRKYSCVVIKPDAEKMGMIKKVKNFVAYGNINGETFEKLVEKRGQLLDKKKTIDAKKIVSNLKEGKTYEENNLKPFFRLHPPRKGIDSKIHFGKKKGVLGNNKEKINDLVERML